MDKALPVSNEKSLPELGVLPELESCASYTVGMCHYHATPITTRPRIFDLRLHEESRIVGDHFDVNPCTARDNIGKLLAWMILDDNIFPASARNHQLINLFTQTPMMYSAILIAGLLLCLMSPLPGQPFESSDEFSDSNLDVRNDWVMYIDTCTVPNYLNYPGSSLKPIISVRIRYRIAPELGKPASATLPQRYEELWYHNGVPVGLKRFCNLPEIRHKLGTIMVSYTGNQNQEVLAIANALLRLIIDLDLLPADRSDVVVPSSIYQMVEDDLKQYQFLRRDGLGSECRRVIIHLVSNPRIETMDNYLVHEDSR